MIFENTFQYVGGISQEISVSHFDSRRSLSLTEYGKSTANRRRSTWPILFVSITQPCDVVPSERMLNISKRNLVECTSDLMV